jgi:hypothetical protein
MRTNILAIAIALSDRDLLAGIDGLAGKERETTAELVAHLAALELRPNLYLAQGYGSLFAYCTEALHLSEDAACNRIEAARACRRFPTILDLLGSGSLTLSSVRKLRAHLTPENHEAVLARAMHRTKEQIGELIAELAPKPDVPATVRKVHTRGPTEVAPPATVSSASPSRATSMSLPMDGVIDAPVPGAAGIGASPAPPNIEDVRAIRPEPRPIVQPLSPHRYRVQFTIGQETHDELRRVQALLRREIPDGDPAEIFGRALHLLLEQVERSKLGATTRRRDGAPLRPYENRIRSGTDKKIPTEDKNGIELRERRSRHIPNEVKRKVWWRDAGQCAFVSTGGRRCTERSFLELHHIQPYALDGAATIANISLRCRRHNGYEAEVVFGVRRLSMVTDADAGP